MMRQNLFTKRSSILSIPARLGLVLVLLAGMLGVIPTAPALAITMADTISTGLYHTCEVKTDGTLACRGNDNYGQVSGPNSSSDTFTQVSGGGYHTCGVKTDGTLACWGHDWYGQVSSPNVSSDTFTQVSGGGNHTCGVKTNGSLACWGNNDYGQATPSNQPPTDIMLSNDNVDENQPINTEVGTLTTADPDPGDTHTYSLVGMKPCPGPDNGSFNINTDKLRTSAVFDYETKDSYTICIRTDDGNGGIYDEQFTINVNNVSEAPSAQKRIFLPIIISGG